MGSERSLQWHLVRPVAAVVLCRGCSLERVGSLLPTAIATRAITHIRARRRADPTSLRRRLNRAESRRWHILWSA